MKIICIGRNYAEHAHELGNSLPDEMLFFLKPETAFHNQSVFYLPDFIPVPGRRRPVPCW